MKYLLYVVAILLAAASPAYAGSLPGWFPMTGVKINPDQLAPEDYGTDDFKGPKGEPVTVHGHHWSTALYAGSGDDWNGVAVWKTMRPALEKQGFAVVFLDQHDGTTEASLRKGTGDRADSVKKWLVAHGIATARLTTQGFGDTAPLVPNDGDLNRAKNRRVELAKSGCKS